MTTYAELAEQAKTVDCKAGDFCHIEFPVTDVERAKKFYGEIFGWQFQDIPEMGYTLFITPSGKLGGGFCKPDEHQAAKVVNYINVKSIEETKAAIEARGGKALSPRVDIPDHGSFMQFLDSEGTLIAIWQGAAG